MPVQYSGVLYCLVNNASRIFFPGSEGLYRMASSLLNRRDRNTVEEANRSVTIFLSSSPFFFDHTGVQQLKIPVRIGSGSGKTHDNLRRTEMLPPFVAQIHGDYVLLECPRDAKEVYHPCCKATLHVYSNGQGIQFGFL
jgi:hypothetical protein